MLKIKDNVDLKELEKYGLRPKYDEDTGEIKSYANFIYDDKSIPKYKRHLNILMKNKKLPFRKKKNIFIIDEFYFVGHNLGVYDESCNFDLLYDLIKADLVEKVEE